MRAFIVTLAGVICIAFLAYGHFYWKDKTKVSSISPEVQSVSNEVETEEPNKKAENETIDLNVLEYAENWPDEAQESFHSALENGEKYKIAIVGSQALGGKDGWADMLKKELEETYGENALSVVLYQYDDVNSDQFIQNGQMEEIADGEPNLVLFEPFTLNDNGKIAVKKNHENIETFMDAIEEANSDAVVILQPTHPVHKGPIYAGQVKSLKEFANNQDIPYLDHWSEWPDRMNDEIKDYLLEDQSATNEKGNELWYEYLREYFVAE
ncbi:SGNH/GDSL hydrolase family protein [Lederbergia citrea]|uniref:SGNH/GDSL hydrolase family protein n=1 Tax=Lederbergia citrea TaxID=2833581 RepID=A0A942UUY6_9BACI|nr:SGNH/GDSL hydrolase family protein [Lederbergia citrea]MBS4223359.1 SGNH/GDSL hydrolase family protein [Lederbergia citrea]